MTASVLRREFGSYFNTAIGYVIMAAFLLLTCLLYVNGLFLRGTAEMREYFGQMPVLMLFFVPAISMRLWSEERKLGTMEVLMTMPLKSWQAVLGKYLAALLFMLVMLGLSLHLPIVMKWWLHGNPDVGQIVAGYAGALVLGMIYLSIGAFASSITSDQIVAFVIALGISFVFFLMGQQDVLAWIKEWSPATAEIVERFGVDYHFQSITRGVLDTRDILYALTITGLFLFLNVLVVERRR
ncbi:MAG: ABC transporter permease subunit [Planctomycetota bacterium]